MLDKEAYTYSELVGSLLYLSVCTRPDIAQAVGVLSRHMSKPSMEHWTAAKGVLRYLAGTLQHGIKFGQGSAVVEGYCDADYAADVDTRRSTSGCTPPGPKSWKCCSSWVTARSSTAKSSWTTSPSRSCRRLPERCDRAGRVSGSHRPPHAFGRTASLEVKPCAPPRPRGG